MRGSDASTKESAGPYALPGTPAFDMDSRNYRAYLLKQAALWDPAGLSASHHMFTSLARRRTTMITNP